MSKILEEYGEKMYQEGFEEGLQEAKREVDIKRDVILPISLGVIIFVFVVVFYTYFHPLYIFDTDDWTYIAANRVPLPSTDAWNPTRILPEVLMPLTASLGGG